uniref:Uncharacterized protein n=1 Tax=Ditylum brightwellii TaxID=49249 RepID=A0A7S4V6R0_9STRA
MTHISRKEMMMTNSFTSAITPATDPRLIYADTLHLHPLLLCFIFLVSDQGRKALMTFFTQNNDLSEEDVLFGAKTGIYSYGNHNDGVDKEKHRDPQKWRQLLNEAAESWSYIYVPQCTADSHLGAHNYQGGNNILHRGGYRIS